MRHYSFLVPVFLAAIIMTPTAAVRWKPDRKSLAVVFDHGDPAIEECIQSGLEVRYRIELKICHHRQGWFDGCMENQLITRTVQFDPIGENYKITTDLINDSAPPSSIIETDPDVAAEVLQNYIIEDFARPYQQSIIKKPDRVYYLSMRARGFCQQDEQSLIAQIPYYLTLGIFRFSGFDTGWVDYQLTQ